MRALLLGVCVIAIAGCEYEDRMKQCEDAGGYYVMSRPNGMYEFCLKADALIKFEE